MKSVQNIALAACLMVLGWVGMAAADTLTVTVNNYYGETVQVEFYSQWYDDAWPGGDQAFVVDYSETMLLNCEPGEQIAFGAWVKNAPISTGVSATDIRHALTASSRAAVRISKVSRTIPNSTATESPRATPHPGGAFLYTHKVAAKH